MTLRWFVAVYRAALRAAPEAFRRRYGDEALDVAARRVSDCPGRSRPLAALREVADLAATIRLERRATHNYRAGAGMRLVETLVQDVRYGVRSLRKSPGFTAATMLTLALGIGATTAIFSVIDAVLLRPLPYPDSQRLVRIIERTARQVNDVGYRQSLASIWTPDLPVLRAEIPTLSNVGVYSSVTATVVIESGSPLRLDGSQLSRALFDMLGARPSFGRLFLATEETPSAEPVVVLSDSMWQRYFGGQTDVLGRRMLVDGRASTIVGVMPPQFQFPDAQTLFWLPFPVDARMWRAPIGRLADGVTLEAASSNVNAVLHQIRKTEPRVPGTTSASGVSRFEVQTIKEHLVAPVRPVLVVLAFAVACVLIIACVNVTNLLLTRNAVRRRELAIRVALGASPARVVRYVLTETLLVATGGGAAGVLFAVGTVEWLRALGTSLARQDLTPGVSIPRLEGIRIDGTALLFTVAITLCVGLLVGLLPIVRHALARHVGALQSSLTGAASVHASPSRGGRAALLVAQTALATMALVGGGLLVHSFLNLASVDPGYDPTHLLTFSVRSSSSAGSVRFDEEVAERLRALPGVKAVGYTELLPMVRFRTGGSLTPAEPMPPGTPPPPAPIDMRTVSHDFITAMGMRIVAGRSLRQDDGRAVVINETLARSGFLGRHALGQRVLVAGNPDPFDVVGIVRDVREYGLDQDPDPQVFVDARQLPPGNPSPYFAMRVDGDPTRYVSSVRDALRQMDASLADDVATMQQVVSNALSRPRLFAALAAAFGIVGGVLAAVGVFGVTAYAVTQRTRELAIRVALGARPTQLLLLVMRQVVALTAVGLCLGVVGSLALSRYLRGVLFGLTPLDPTTFAVVSAMFLIVATLAILIPARRVTRVDPVVALRTAS
jgi:putative ABC transport system permease protein